MKDSEKTDLDLAKEFKKISEVKEKVYSKLFSGYMSNSVLAEMARAYAELNAQQLALYKMCQHKGLANSSKKL
jgi:hypothetical protein